MKIKSLTFLTTLLFSHFAFADSCSNLAGQWHGLGHGEIANGAVKCTYEGSVTISEDGEGSFVVIDSKIQRKDVPGDNPIICLRDVSLQNGKVTCDKGLVHVKAETKAKDGKNSTIDLSGIVESPKSVKLSGTMVVGGKNTTADLKDFNLDKQ